jgi:hypothetical protein
MSEKMMSQNKSYVIKLVPYNKPHLDYMQNLASKFNFTGFLWYLKST